MKSRGGNATRPLRLALLLSLLLTSLVVCSPASAARTDVIELANGDRLTCEVKRLDRGLLRVSTDSLGTVEIIWTDVVAMTSSQRLEVETNSGARYLGPIEPVPESPGTLRIEDGAGGAQVPMRDVVRITPIESTFLERLDGSFDLGLSLARANDARDLSVGLRASTRKQKWRRSLEVTSLVSEQDGAEPTDRANAVYTANRFLGERRFTFLRGQGEHNDELAVDWRAVAAAGFGRYQMQTNTSELAWATGLAVNREKLQGVEGADTSLEGLLGVTYGFFRLHSPEVDVQTNLIVYPSLSESGRLRAEASVLARQEVVKDFFFGLTALWSHDNQPPLGSAETDWALTTSLGWSW